MISHMSKKEMTTYLTNLIEEKGSSLDAGIPLEDHIGLTWGDLVRFIENAPDYHETIRATLVKIDFLNGDVFHYLLHLAHGMVATLTAQPRG